MSVSSSTVPAVKKKLLELIKTVVSEETTEVWAASPNEDHSLAENIYIGHARGTREFRTLGAATTNQREERYTVQVTVQVYREGSDTVGTEERLFELVEAVEKTLAEHRELAGTTVQWSIVGEFAQSTVAAREGVLSSYPFEVQVTARI